MQGTEVLGRSPAMEALRLYSQKVARSEAPTLITGSTGTGKEHLARAVHAGSARAAMPFVALNCAAIPESLFESEMFGHERGSFTGAVQARRGHATLADRGTLFLDEVGELSPAGQSKLLRLLEQREVQPVGASRPQPVDIRIVAATNRDIEAAVETGAFRSDLYYRLNVARLDIPDLAERPEDVPVYVAHFTERFNARRGANVGAPDPALASVLSRYAWPGNVREVRNFVEGVFIDPPDGPIGMAHVPLAFAHIRHGWTRAPADERGRLIAALERCNWNKVETARSLRWSRMTLYRKLAKYDVDVVKAPGL